jgi:protein-cysteine N-palmitoyltransferase HHAT
MYSAKSNIRQDLTDAQYSTFRGNVPYLAILLFGQPLLRRLYDSLWPSPTRNGPSKTNGSPYIPAIEADARLNRRASFDFGFAFVFLTAMHGVSALKILLILYVNFSIGTRLPRKFIPAVTWIFNVSILFANELCGGYKFADIASSLLPVVEGESLHHSWGAWLDGYGGIMSRWEVLFNLTVLRLISFNMDYYFSLDARSGSPIEVSHVSRTHLGFLLMLTRRNNWTPQTSPKGIELQPRPPQKTLTSATILVMPSMPLYT